MTYQNPRIRRRRANVRHTFEKFLVDAMSRGDLQAASRSAGTRIRRGRHGWVRVRVRTTGVHRATTRLALCRGPPYFVGIQFPQEWVGWRRDSRAWGWRSISPHLTADANASSSRLNYHVGWALVLRRDAHVARRREPAALGRSRPRKDGSMCASASAFFACGRKLGCLRDLDLTLAARQEGTRRRTRLVSTLVGRYTCCR